MDLNTVLLASWRQLLELLETSECTRQGYHASTTTCLVQTSPAYLLERSAFYNKKHSFSKHANLVVRMGVIKKDMNAHAHAIYSAWESMASLQAEYAAILEVHKKKTNDAAERESIAVERMNIREEAAAKNRALTRKSMDKKGIDLGGAAEDAADAVEDERLERKARKARAKEEAEQKEEERMVAIRTYVVTSFPIEQAGKLLKVLKNLSSQEAEAFLLTVRNEKGSKKTPPGPPPIVANPLAAAQVHPSAPVMNPSLAASQVPAPVPVVNTPLAEVPASAPVLNAPTSSPAVPVKVAAKKSILTSLDADEYSEPSLPKVIRRKKNKNPDSSSSESESDFTVSLPDSPRKQQRVTELENSMSSVNLYAAA